MAIKRYANALALKNFQFPAEKITAPVPNFQRQQFFRNFVITKHLISSSE